MQTRLSIIAFMATASVAVSSPKKLAVQDRISDADLNARRADSVLPYAGLEGAGVKASEKAEKTEEKDEVADLLARSVFLTDGRQCTILPAGAVIHVPKNREDRVVKSSPPLPMVSWDDFIRVNSSWLREFGLDHEQAAGTKPFEPRLAQALGASGCVVVSTYFRQPVAPVAGVKTAFAKALEERK
jgi:hypothetical protein